jgi:hypothetical protein
MGLTRDGGGCACFGAVRATALAHALVCRRRWLYNNQISTIANGAFAGLTALSQLYGAGLRARSLGCLCISSLLLRCLVFATMWGAEGSFPRAHFRPASFYNGIIT